MVVHTGIVIGIFCYFLGIIFVGYLLRHKNKTAEDFLVGGRSFGILFNAGTLTSCWVGGALIVGIPGTFYSLGIWNSDAMYGILVSFGSAGCLILAGMFYMRKLWGLKLLSLGDFYYKRYGGKAGLVATILMALTFTVWISVQVIAFAKVGSALVGFSLNTWIILALAVICTYTILGGLWAVCLTDLIQVVIVTVSLFILTPVAIGMVGGLDVFWNHVPKEKLEWLPRDMGSFKAWLPWLGALCTVGLGSIASPDLMQRAFSAKTGRTASHSAYVATAAYLVILVTIIILTLATMQMVDMGTVDKALIEGDPELMIPLVFQNLMPGPLVVLFLGAVMAAVMSAAATANIALAGVISKNLIHDVFFPDMSSRNLMQLTRVVILVIGVIAAGIAVGLPSAYLLTSLGFDLILSCLFIPLTLGLYWSKANGLGAIAGLVGGAVFRIGGAGMAYGFGVESIAAATTTDTWFYFTLGGPLFSLACMVLVTLLTQKIDKPIVLEIEPDPA